MVALVNRLTGATRKTHWRGWQVAKRSNIIESAEKKLQEARAFLVDMRDQEQRAFGDKERFDHYLSGFLGAGMSVRGVFHVKQN